MKLIRMLDNQGSWYPLYFREIKNRVRRDKNLSDIHDIVEARNNLGLGPDAIFTESTGHSHEQYMTSEQVNSLVTNLFQQQIQPVIAQMEATLNNTNSAIQSLNEQLDDYLKKELIVISQTVPSQPKDNMIWFCTAPSNHHIEVYTNGAWYKIGAVWQ